MSYKNIPRLYINKELYKDNKVILDKNDAHYLRNVLRMSLHNEIRVFNGKNGEWEAIIITKDCNKIELKELKKKQVKFLGPSIYFSLIKSHNLRWLIEKCTELGVKNFYPLLTERVNIRNFKHRKTLSHIKESSEVSERLELPKLHELQTLQQMLFSINKNSSDFIFCNEARQDMHISKYLGKKFSQEVSFIIGPEGGFSDNELASIREHPKINSVKIHDRILKAETAAVFVMSLYNNFLQLKKTN